MDRKAIQKKNQQQKYNYGQRWEGNQLILTRRNQNKQSFDENMANATARSNVAPPGPSDQLNFIPRQAHFIVLK